MTDDDPPLSEARREALLRRAEARADAVETAVVTAVQAWLDRMRGVTLSRMRGPASRKHTRWWGETKGNGYDLAPAGREFKAVDADYVLPDRLVDELADPFRDVVWRVAVNAAEQTASDLGAPPDNPFVLDRGLLDDAVEQAVADMLDIGHRHAAMIREEITRADATADSLDEVLDMIDAAFRRGGNWIMLSGRTLGLALANDAALRQARALGSTHKRWLSRRDGRVRPTHVQADGQSQKVDDLFEVGLFKMRFPADPTDLPKSWHEVAGCRCTMLFSSRSTSTPVRGGDPRDAVAVPRPRLEGEDGGGLTEEVVGYHPIGASAVMNPGDRVRLGAGTVLALTAPAVGATLAVAIPVGWAIQTAEGTVQLLADAMAQVTEVDAEQVRARLNETTPTSG